MGRTFSSNIVNSLEDGTFFVENEVPTGAVNGANTLFTFTYTPDPTQEIKVYVNGQRMKETDDYTVSGDTLTLNTAPPTNSIILVDYHVTPA